MENRESMVYMKRPAGIPPSLSTSKTRMKRHRCRDDSSVAWYNLEKTKPVNEHSCTEFDDYSRTKDSLQDFHSMQDLKHRQKKNKAITGFESGIHEQVDNSSSKASSSKSTECNHSSASNSQDPDCDQMPQDSTLVDVPLTVKSNRWPENVPFVSLTSKQNGKAILGYPVEVGVLGSERGAFGVEGSRFQGLIWRKSKRTPVCYVANSVSKNSEGGKTSRNSEALANEKGMVVKEKKGLGRLVKNPKEFNQGKAALSRACVPVELVFSRIQTAVG